MGLPCLNCGVSVPASSGKVFAECFLCDGCHTIAVRAHEQVQAEIKLLQTSMMDLLRIAIVRKQLALPEAQEAVAPSFSFIELISRMAKEGYKCQTKTSSTASLAPSNVVAPTAALNVQSSSQRDAVST